MNQAFEIENAWQRVHAVLPGQEAAVLNCVRRTLIDGVPTLTIQDLRIDTAASVGTLDVYNNEYIAQRLRCIPVLRESYVGAGGAATAVNISFENPAGASAWVAMTPANAITPPLFTADSAINDDLPILYIPPGARFVATAALRPDTTGTGKFAHAWYEEADGADGDAADDSGTGRLRFFVESVGRTPNTAAGAAAAFDTALATLAGGVRDALDGFMRVNGGDGGRDGATASTPISREYVFEDVDRSVLNMLVATARHYLAPVVADKYLFAVVQPHMSRTRSFKILVQLTDAAALDAAIAALETVVRDGGAASPLTSLRVPNTRPLTQLVRLAFAAAVMAVEKIRA